MPARVGSIEMKAGRRPPRVSACLALAALIVGLVAVAPALANGEPTINSFSPSSGPVGTSVTINGTNLTGATWVKFNGVMATITSNTATQIVTEVPTGATTGPITAKTTSGTATSPTTFTVTPTAAPPTISSFSPTSGPAGTAVTITGTAFTGATAVRFGGVRASFVVNSATQITATVPVGAVTGKISVT